MRSLLGHYKHYKHYEHYDIFYKHYEHYDIFYKHYEHYETLQTFVPGIVLLIVPNRKIKKAANIILLVAKLLNLYSHFAIDDQFERMAPTLVFFFMLVCRMVVDWQFVNNVPPPQVNIN